MNSTPPFIAQERPDPCAIACLRMILANEGKHIAERDAIGAADFQAGGLTPEELRNLARQFGLESDERQVDEAELAELVQSRRFPIVFLFRGPLDGIDMTHAVIPIRRARRYITFLDPLRGVRRVSIRKFEEARRLVGRWVVVRKSK